MKFLYLSLIALCMMFIFSTSAYALHSTSTPVLYMKSNTIGHIYIEFSTTHPNQTIKLGPMEIYDANLTNHIPLNLTDLSVIPNSTSITLSDDKIVDYTVTAKNDLKGIYALHVDHFADRSSVIEKVPWNATIGSYSKAFCHVIPLVIGLNSSQVSQDTLDGFDSLNGSKNCSVPLVDRWFTGRTQTIERMPGTHMVGVRPITASMDKDVYLPGDTATVHGYLYTNDTNVTIELEKDRSVIVESKNVPVMQNKTFVSSFTIPRNYANTWSVMISSKNAGNLILGLNFDSLPLKQFESGISAKDVVCKQEYQLIFKAEDGSPACVKPDTASILVKRGWAISTIKSIHDASNQEMNGTLSGNIIRAGGPRSDPQANYEVDVYASDGITIVGKTLSDANGNYSIQLPAGNYTIYAPDYPIRQTHLVSVISGENTVLNITYGTGYK